jgi:hypothetical protein
MPDFFDKYSAYILEKMKASGASQQAINAKLQEMTNFKRMYDNPLINAAFTFTEPFPVGLIITLISSALLRKKGAALKQDSANRGRSADVLDQTSSV